MESFLRSWPTTVAGILLILITIAFVMKVITLQEWIAAFGVVAGSGLMLSKTFNVSGPPKG